MRTTPSSARSPPVWTVSDRTADSTASAAESASRPRSVSSQPPATRASTRPPIVCSRAAMRREIVVWLRPSSSAAVVYRPDRPTASNTRRSSALGLRPDGNVISAFLQTFPAVLVIAGGGTCMNTHSRLCGASQIEECPMTIQNETPPAGTEPDSIPTGLKRVVLASMAGTVVEWYEFFLYATAATLVFNKVFFAEGAGDKALIAALLTYGVGFLARPLGGIVFGHFGDKYGRKKLLQLAIILVGVATFLMGCLPTFDQIGYLAPILLIVLRFFQ